MNHIYWGCSVRLWWSWEIPITLVTMEPPKSQSIMQSSRVNGDAALNKPTSLSDNKTQHIKLCAVLHTRQLKDHITWLYIYYSALLLFFQKALLREREGSCETQGCVCQQRLESISCPLFFCFISPPFVGFLPYCSVYCGAAVSLSHTTRIACSWRSSSRVTYPRTSWRCLEGIALRVLLHSLETQSLFSSFMAPTGKRKYA